MRRLRDLARAALRLPGRREGSIGPLVGLSLAVLCGCAGLGVDLGLVYLEKRRIQSAADLAALAAVRAIGNPAAASRALADNGYPAPEALSVTPGLYRATRAVAPSRRFAPGGSPPNAVRVALSGHVRAGFSRAVGGPAHYTVSGQATALRADLAVFGIGSRLAGLDGGIVNGLLSGLLGTRLSLSLTSYRALAGLDIDALAFLQAAALQANLKAATFNDVLDASLSLVELTAAMRSAAGSAAGVQASGAFTALAAALSGDGGRVHLGDLLTVGELGTLPLATAGEPLLVNAFGLLTEAAVVANRTDQVALDLGAGVPGLLQARLTLRIGQGWQTSGSVAPGATLNTAQTRALLEVTLAGPPGMANLTVPIYVEMARASATLRRITCPWTARSERAVTLDVSTGAAYLAIGSLGTGSLDPAAPRPVLNPATILRGPPLLNVSASASLPIGTTTRSLTFTDADIAAGHTRTVSADNLVGSLTGALLADLTLRVNGLPLTGVPPLQAALAAVLEQAAAPIDALLFSVLGSLGLRIGAADVAVTGTRCGGAVLVE